MRNKTLIAALALAMVTGLVFAGEPGQPPRPRDDSARYHSDSDDYGPHKRRGDRDRDDWRGPRHDMKPGMGMGMCGSGMCPGMGMMGMRRGMGMRHGMGPGMGMILADRLDLTAEQKTQLVTILTENFRSGLELRFQMADAMKKVRDVRRDENASSDSIIAANRELGEIKGEMQALRSGLKAKLAAILTPEQKEKLDDIRRLPPPPVRGDRWGGPGHDGPGAGRQHDRDGWRHGPRGPWTGDDAGMDDGANDADDMDI